MSAGSGEGEEEVVLRNPNRNSGRLSVKAVEVLKEGEKRVQWSESTDLREKMKEYRRSQLSMSLDYHHIAIEEERERAGVKEWRDSLQLNSQRDEEQENSCTESSNQKDGNKQDEEDDNSDVSSESDEFHPSMDEDLERKLRVIKATTTKHTLLPAYRAAVKVYEPWLAENISSLPQQDIENYEEQCKLYSQVLGLYDEWSAEDSSEQIDRRFDRITELIQKSKEIGEPPSSVADAISEVLTSEENIKKQKAVYEQMVNDMVTAFETTSL